MLPETEDPIRTRARQAAANQLATRPDVPMLAVDAYFEAMIAGLMDAKSATPGATFVKIQRVKGPAPYTANIYRGDAQHEPMRSVPIGVLAERLNQQADFHGAMDSLEDGNNIPLRPAQLQGSAQGKPYVATTHEGLIGRICQNEGLNIQYVQAVRDVAALSQAAATPRSGMAR